MLFLTQGKSQWSNIAVNSQARQKTCRPVFARCTLDHLLPQIDFSLLNFYSFTVFILGSYFIILYEYIKRYIIAMSQTKLVSTMMKKTALISATSFCLLLLFGATSISFAQLRENQSKSSELMGPVVKNDPSEGANLGNLFNMQMDHSYSMMFSSFGGQFQNVNAYTNTMHFFFSEDLTGRLDLSLLHSPFGNSFMSNDNGMNTQFLIRNAELNYQISDKSNIRIQFQQVPGYGANPWSPFGSPFYDRNF